MIMMRSNPNVKVNKPPPPVPPRPNKTVVAEALAKSKKPENISNITNANININTKPCVAERNFKVFGPIVKSQSYSSVNNYTNIVPKNENNSISLDGPPKPATRTLVYQSANAKNGSIQEIKVNVNRKESVKRVNNVTRTSSFKTNKNETSLSRPQSFKSDGSKANVYKILIENKTKKSDSFNSKDSSLESLGKPDKGNGNENENISRSGSFKNNEIAGSDSAISEDDNTNKLDDFTDNDINDRNHVNTLIDEMFASVLEYPDEELDKPVQVYNDNIPIPLISPITNINTENKIENKKTIVIIDDKPKKVQFQPENFNKKKVIDDKFNHELLISELAGMNMRQEQERISKRQRKPSLNINEESKIQHSDWVEVNNGQEVRLSSCHITIKNEDCNSQNLLSRFNEMSNLHGLPPLPKSLSGFSLIENQQQTQGRAGSSRNSPYTGYLQTQKGTPNGEVGSLRKGNNLDDKLALLRREMYSLRQLDLSLLSQLWSLNESIQDFRNILQEQDERNILSPPSPSPTPSSGDDADADEFYAPSPRFRPAPPPPPHRRPSNSSTGTGSSV